MVHGKTSPALQWLLNQNAGKYEARQVHTNKNIRHSFADDHHDTAFGDMIVSFENRRGRRLRPFGTSQLAYPLARGASLGSATATETFTTLQNAAECHAASRAGSQGMAATSTCLTSTRSAPTELTHTTQTPQNARHVHERPRMARTDALQSPNEPKCDDTGCLSISRYSQSPHETPGAHQRCTDHVLAMHSQRTTPTACQ